MTSSESRAPPEDFFSLIASPSITRQAPRNKNNAAAHPDEARDDLLAFTALDERRRAEQAFAEARDRVIVTTLSEPVRFLAHK
jgi:hypothetical protein